MDERTQWLVDRLEIDDLLARYATAIDGRRWDLLDTVFTADAHLDYRSAGGICGPYPEVRQWLEDVLPIFEVTQHHLLNRVVELADDGARARARTGFLNPNQLTVDDAPWLFVVGGYYHDALVRAPDGWRIASRVEETSWWDHPMPGLAPRPEPVPVAMDWLTGRGRH
jgi:3-phenylpropionate/cinnamic acid dioxygenase small subunit